VTCGWPARPPEVRVRVVSVIFRAGDAVLRWNEALERSWRSFDAGSEDRLVVIAVDNASGDGTPDRLMRQAPGIELRRQVLNRGFAAGCNVGLASAEPGELIVLLNPDVEVGQDFFAVLATLDWPENLAARGPAVRTPEGRVEQSARGFPRASTGMFGRTSLLSKLLPESAAASRNLRADPHAGARTVDWVSGACMIVPTERFERVGSFDEGYFMYWEDADWCKRAHDLGFETLYDPSLEVVHRQGASSAHRPVATTLSFHRSAWRYYDRHAASSRLVSCLAAVALLGLSMGKVLIGVGRRAVGTGRPFRSSVSAPDQ